jgi:NADPH-dependent ferric siderophore reductase
MTTLERATTRVRHELKRRLLQVKRVTPVTPKMVRVTLEGPELEGFVSAAHDDHCKVMFPLPGDAKPLLPGPDAPEDAPRAPARDYTPRRYDADAGELDIDFVLHGDGPATTWAAQVAPGQYLSVGGPRGSFVVSNDFDWYLLVGDESALPAIGRRLEELPAGCRAIVIAEVADAAEEQQFQTKAHLEVIWLHRDGAEPGGSDLLVKALADTALPSGAGYAWAAAEADTAKALRRHLVEERGHPKEWVKAAAYWRRGDVAVHETYND